MARLSRHARSISPSKRSTTARTFHFMLLGQAVVVLRDHWQSIPAADRARLTELVKASRGRPMHLTPHQRSELSAIVKRVDLPGLSRDLAPLAARRATRRGPLRRR
jgi:hypothetical protein